LSRSLEKDGKKEANEGVKEGGLGGLGKVPGKADRLINSEKLLAQFGIVGDEKASTFKTRRAWSDARLIPPGYPAKPNVFRGKGKGRKRKKNAK